MIDWSHIQVTITVQSIILAIFVAAIWLWYRQIYPDGVPKRQQLLLKFVTSAAATFTVALILGGEQRNIAVIWHRSPLTTILIFIVITVALVAIDWWRFSLYLQSVRESPRAVLHTSSAGRAPLRIRIMFWWALITGVMTVVIIFWRVSHALSR
ncbi:MAG: hypothetical protein ACJ71N_08405 [Terriglobales bacterium]|jgi:F0F1-type ATP synthase membrane subunit a